MPLTAENCPALILGPGGALGKAADMKENIIRAEVIKQTSISGNPARVGSIVDLPEAEHKRMAATGRVREADKGAKPHYVTKDEALAAAKANAAPSGGSQNRDRDQQRLERK